jgi:hypothetical protein
MICQPKYLKNLKKKTTAWTQCFFGGFFYNSQGGYPPYEAVENMAIISRKI